MSKLGIYYAEILEKDELLRMAAEIARKKKEDDS